MRAELDKAKKAQTKAENARKTAEDAMAEAQKELERARAEAQAIREDAARAEKKAALTSSEDLVLFRALFDQAQDMANKMGGVLMKVRNKDSEKAGGLSKALLALSDKFREVAQA